MSLIACLCVIKCAVSPRRVTALLLTPLLISCSVETKTGEVGTGGPPPPIIDKSVSGSIVALGATGVAGLAINDTNAAILLNLRRDRAPSELRLGMGADVIGSGPLGEQRMQAATLSAQSLISGPVGAVDTAARQFDVVGVRVRVDQNTLLDGFTSIAALQPGQAVDVYGLAAAPGGAILATRIVAQQPSVSGNQVDVVGRLDSVTAAALTVAGVTVDTRSATQSSAFGPPVSAPPGAPINVPGATIVRVRGELTPGTNTLVAREVVLFARPPRADGAALAIEGIVSAIVDVNRIVVDGETADTTGATLPAGVALAVGQRVIVDGTRTAGVLRAATIQVIGADQTVTYTVEGPITTFLSTADFTIRGERIDARNAELGNGNASDLGVNRRLRVVGVAGPGVLTARQVEFLQ